MKIIKYLLLLIVLFFIAASVFVATLNPEYKVVRNQIINSKRTKVFSFVNDYKNWEDFGIWEEDNPKMQFEFSKKTIGKGSKYSWKGEDETGKIETISIIENEQISQKMITDGKETEVLWKFKDTLGKTKVSIETKGKFSFWEKMNTKLTGGIDRIIGPTYEKSLANLNRNLDFEINNFSVTVNGYMQKTGGYYIRKTVNCKSDDVIKNIQILIPTLEKYVKNKKISTSGKPFIIYNFVDNIKKTTKLSVGFLLKTKDSIDIKSGFSLDSIKSFQVVKSTLTGDYSHFNSVKEKSLEYIYTYQLLEDFRYPKIEVYIKSKNEVKNPSKWITEIYYPVKPKNSNAKSSNNQTVDSSTTTTEPQKEPETVELN